MCKENEEGIKTIPVKDILEDKDNFFIPNYQRGYRWDKQQVRDLLEDINEFSPIEKEDFYCLQPLVVKEMTEDEKKKNNLEISEKWYEVIDGQQRLTTIFIILKYLGLENDELYSLKYSTRPDSKDFLEKLDKKEEKDAEENIDYYHMWTAYNTIKSWFSEERKDVDKEAFKNKLLNNVQFIWYETEEKDPIKVFTRLNIGKIPLTNSELIKALFLNKSNFENEEKELDVVQKNIADDWYEIESELQDEEFWMVFLNREECDNYKKPTRIDFIFELICEKDMLNLGQLSPDKMKRIGNDDYKTFRYFYEYFKENEKKEEKKIPLKTLWKNYIKSIFDTLQEWGNNKKDNSEQQVNLHNFVGYIIAVRSYISLEKFKEILRVASSNIFGENIFEGKNVLEEIKDGKYMNIYDLIYILRFVRRKNEEGLDGFEKYLKGIIKLIIEINGCCYLDKPYEISGSPKSDCLPLLLLHNIQSEKKKFEFHLYKKDKWDIEHIDSHTPNSLTEKKDQNEWLLDNFNGVDDSIIKDEIEKFVTNPNPDSEKFEEIIEKLPKSDKENDCLDEDEKNQIKNFALLDSGTNRGYGNAIFATKKRIIEGKNKGKIPLIPTIKKISEDKSNNEKKYKFVPGGFQETKITFIPAYTKYIFSVLTGGKNYWDKRFAEEYKQVLCKDLSEFGVKMEGYDDKTGEKQ